MLTGKHMSLQTMLLGEQWSLDNPKQTIKGFDKRAWVADETWSLSTFSAYIPLRLGTGIDRLKFPAEKQPFWGAQR